VFIVNKYRQIYLNIRFHYFIYNRKKLSVLGLNECAYGIRKYDLVYDVT